MRSFPERTAIHIISVTSTQTNLPAPIVLKKCAVGLLSSMDISYVWESLEPHSRHWVIGIRSFDVVVTLLSRTLWQKGECSECSRLDWLRLVISGYKFPFQISKSSSLVLNVPMTLPCFWNWVSSIGSSGPARGFPRHGSKCYSEIAFHLITSHQYSTFHHLYIYIWDRGDFRAPWSCCFSNLLG